MAQLVHGGLSVLNGSGIDIVIRREWCKEGQVHQEEWESGKCRGNWHRTKWSQHGPKEELRQASSHSLIALSNLHEVNS